MDIENRLDIIDNRLENSMVRMEARFTDVDTKMADGFAELRMLMRTVNSKIDRILIKIDDHEKRLTEAGI